MKIHSGKSPVVEILNSMQDCKIVDEFYAIVNVPMEEPLFHKIFPGRNLGSMTFATAENFEINSSYCSNLVTVLVLQVTLKRPCSIILGQQCSGSRIGLINSGRMSQS